MDKVVVVGAGQAAIWTAKTLRSEGYTGSITIIGDEKYAFYERPPLSKQVLLGEVVHESLKIFKDEVVAELNIELLKPVKVTHIDRQNKTVYTNTDQTITYDKLLIATGSKAKIPVKKWSTFHNVVSLRNIEDSLLIEEKLNNVDKVGIIGGGWIGLEVAASLSKRNIDVTVYEMNDRLCTRSVSQAVSDYLLKLHKQHGVHIKLSCKKIDLNKSDVNQSINVRIDNDDDIVTYDLVFLGTGAHINKEIAEMSGLDTSDGIVVDEYCQTNDPDVYAAGDVAIHPNLGFCIQSWSNAQHQGVIAAQSMLDQKIAYEETPWLWSDQYDKNIQILGSPVDIDDCQLVIRADDSNDDCFFYLDDEKKLRYLVAVNNNKIVKIAKRWIKAELPLDPEVLKDNSFNLMKIKPK
ncbi:FAD-dependent oxidoreductase [Psychrobacter sp. NZS113]|uniref:NAD(P)/FAD-dependent oxidoreductase n=1 Tax=Psychrobacter sp. NZS113 TaxID=2792045 RepID=UPI0018CD1237|nr:FAD-dependent oxidoreductase [Psychrobacter sp. NZS113]MBH0095762.1 FAD-dependent oxidoreductase [Psychrobacter sp. NZS113]